ncbi:MAG: lamin tail domain-containing protein, partial [Verrucomicrobia bacterium]|nr:lamin tail domain-containing protein [Verrucomicrobiota bacterium]
PSSDYDRSRCALAMVWLGTNLTTVAYSNTIRSESMYWPAFVTNEPVEGLTALMRYRLSNNPALGPVSAGNKVLIAWNSVNKFGTPVNGTSYTTNQALPYTNGGPTLTAAVVIASFDPGTNTFTLTKASLPSGSTNFYKIWAVDANLNYSAGPVAGVTNDGLPRLFVNEFYAAAAGTVGDPDWIELYNPAFVPVNLGGLQIRGRDTELFRDLPAGTNIPARGFLRFFANNTSSGLNLQLELTNKLGNIVLQRALGGIPIARYPYATQYVSYTEGPAWDGGPRGYVSSTTPARGAMFYNGTTQPTTPGTNNDRAPHRYLTVAADVTGTSNYLAWQNVGVTPATWRYSPKQYDGHALNVEDLAFRTTNEMIIALRAPLTNRTSGNAYYFRVTNVWGFATSANWDYGAAMTGIAGPYQMNLGGLGFRSIKWCPALAGGAGRYLILAGTANGGPLQREEFRQKFSLYSWTGNTNTAPSKLIDDLWPYAIRPEGVDLMNVGGTWRVLFVEDRFLGTGYATRNAIHWPLDILGTVP